MNDYLSFSTGKRLCKNNKVHYLISYHPNHSNNYLRLDSKPPKINDFIYFSLISFSYDTSIDQAPESGYANTSIFNKKTEM